MADPPTSPAFAASVMPSESGRVGSVGKASAAAIFGAASERCPGGRREATPGPAASRRCEWARAVACTPAALVHVSASATASAGRGASAAVSGASSAAEPSSLPPRGASARRPRVCFEVEPPSAATAEFRGSVSAGSGSSFVRIAAFFTASRNGAEGRSASGRKSRDAGCSGLPREP
jgi:hypothetical protein